MYTIYYRGLYIQAYHDDRYFFVAGYPNIKCKTLRSAKMLVTKILRKIYGWNVPLSELTY